MSSVVASPSMPVPSARAYSASFTPATGTPRCSPTPMRAPVATVCIVIRNGKLAVAIPPAATSTTIDSPTNATPAAARPAATSSSLTGSSTWYEPDIRLAPVEKLPSALMSMSCMVLRSGPRSFTFALASRPATTAWSSAPAATSGAIAAVIEGSPSVYLLSCTTSSMNSIPDTDAVRVCVPLKFTIADWSSISSTVFCNSPSAKL